MSYRPKPLFLPGTYVIEIPLAIHWRWLGLYSNKRALDLCKIAKDLCKKIIGVSVLPLSCGRLTESQLSPGIQGSNRTMFHIAVDRTVLARYHITNYVIIAGAARWKIQLCETFPINPTCVFVSTSRLFWNKKCLADRSIVTANRSLFWYLRTIQIMIQCVRFLALIPLRCLWHIILIAGACGSCYREWKRPLRSSPASRAHYSFYTERRTYSAQRSSLAYCLAAWHRQIKRWR